MNCWRNGMTLADVEKEAIILALIHHKQNRRATARALGIAYRTLHYKLVRYDIRRYFEEMEECEA